MLHSPFLFSPLCCVISSEDISEDELDDMDVRRIIIVTQTPTMKKHPGGDRTVHSYHRSKLSVDTAEAINVGLYFYEQVCYMCD